MTGGTAMQSCDTDTATITEANSPWRRFPLAVVAAFVVVFDGDIRESIAFSEATCR